MLPRGCTNEARYFLIAGKLEKAAEMMKAGTSPIPIPRARATISGEMSNIRYGSRMRKNVANIQETINAVQYDFRLPWSDLGSIIADMIIPAKAGPNIPIITNGPAMINSMLKRRGAQVIQLIAYVNMKNDTT